MTDQRATLMVNKLMIEAEHGRIDNDWACGFIMEMKARLNLGRSFSEKQLTKIEELFDRY